MHVHNVFTIECICRCISTLQRSISASSSSMNTDSTKVVDGGSSFARHHNLMLIVYKCWSGPPTFGHYSTVSLYSRLKMISTRNVTHGAFCWRSADGHIVCEPVSDSEYSRNRCIVSPKGEHWVRRRRQLEEFRRESGLGSHFHHVQFYMTSLDREP